MNHLMKPSFERPVASEMKTPNHTTVSQAAFSARASFHSRAFVTIRYATTAIPIAFALKPVRIAVPQPRSARMKPTATFFSCVESGPSSASISFPCTFTSGV